MRCYMFFALLPVLASAKKEEEYLTAKEDGEAFLEDNLKKEDIIGLSSGLQYRVLKKGDGSHNPQAEENVYVYYKGRTLRTWKQDGEPFDKMLEGFNKEDGEAGAKFVAGQLINGLGEAMVLMVEGDKWEIFIPGKLGYGEKGVKKINIAPNECLVFEVEILKIQALCNIFNYRGCDDREKAYIEKWKTTGHVNLRNEHGRMMANLHVYPHFYEEWLNKKFVLLEQMDKAYINKKLTWADQIAPEEMQTEHDEA